jgi:hypothetical protein
METNTIIHPIFFCEITGLNLLISQILMQILQMINDKLSNDKFQFLNTR